MEDLQNKIIELMNLFDGEVTTADKIDRPERALEKEGLWHLRAGRRIEGAL